MKNGYNDGKLSNVENGQGNLSYNTYYFYSQHFMLLTK